MKQLQRWLASASFSLLMLGETLAAQPLPKSWDVDQWVGTWEEEKAERQETLESFIKGKGKKPFQWYRNVPLGHTGLPTVFFRLLPELHRYNVAPGNKAFTDLLNDYRKLWEDPTVYGLVPFPTDFSADGKKLRSIVRAVPYGLGFTQPTESPIEFLPKVNIHLTFVSCASCHTGRVVVDGDKIQYLYGAPTTEYDQTAFSGAQGITAEKIPDDEETLGLLVKTIVKAMDSKPLGYFLGLPLGQAISRDPFAQELSDRLFWKLDGKKILRTVKSRIGLRTRIISLLRNGKDGVYDKPGSPAFNGQIPGRLDAFGFGGAIVATLAEDLFKSQGEAAIDPSLSADEFELASRQRISNLQGIYGQPGNWLHGNAALVDPLSIWQENDEWRTSANWDGSQRTAGARAISTSLAVTANPELVNVKGAEQMDIFMKGLTPPPYPFSIDKVKAKRGQELFEKSCLSCHAPKVDRILRTDEIKVDPNRAMQITEPVREGLLALFWKACKLTAFCGRKDQSPDGQIEDNDKILIPRNENTMGYAVKPLDGIWARAPYLHNGSVPTLRALLTGDRPETFWRGNIRYNQRDVGFSTNDPRTEPYVSMSGSAAIFDTKLIGNGNQGHLSEIIDGQPILGADANGQAIQWGAKDRSEDLEALLEYMKSL